MKHVLAGNQSAVRSARRGRRGTLFAGLTGCVLAGAAAAAPTPISSLPFTISQPGDYQLTQNLTYRGSGDAILGW